MILQKTIEGYVLLRNLYEFNSILKYRYNKLKRYRIASMRHEDVEVVNKKPSIILSVIANIMETQSFIWSTIYNFIKNLFSREDMPRTAKTIINNYATRYPIQYERLMSMSREHREAKERVITHVRYVGRSFSMLKKGKFYKVINHIKYEKNKAEFIYFKYEAGYGTGCRKVFNEDGFSQYNGEFELIYNNEF